jgi:hypothetical protein
MPALDTAPWRALGTLLQYQSLLVAVVFGALIGCGLRALLRLLLDHHRGLRHNLSHGVSAAAYGALVLGYAALVGPAVSWGERTLLCAALAAGLVVGGSLSRRFLFGARAGFSPTLALLRLVLLLVILLLALLCLLRTGFLNLTTDRPVLRIEITGETRPQTVRFAPPDEPMQELSLTAHRILFHTPEGEVIAEEWIYGDEVAIKGRVLRLPPLLNAMGISNLFELQFIHNGYLTAERHNSQPHLARPLRPFGTLAVAPTWQPLRDRFWHFLETRPDSSHLATRTVSSESTYFPLLDAQGKPIAKTFALVLTPGGLTTN